MCVLLYVPCCVPPGVRSSAVHSLMPYDVMKGELTRFRSGKLDVLFNVEVLTEGGSSRHDASLSTVSATRHHVAEESAGLLDAIGCPETHPPLLTWIACMGPDSYAW